MKRPLTAKGLKRKQDEDWKVAIRTRDNYTCQICKKDCSNRPHVHHIIPKHITAYRHDLNNGITLCFNHHKVGSYSPHQNALWFVEWMKLNKREQYDYIMNKLDNLKLKDKFVSFTSRYETDEGFNLYAKNGVVEDIKYHIDSNIVTIKLYNDDSYWNVNFLNPVINVNLTRSTQIKYNI